jgi:KamA family protein
VHPHRINGGLLQLLAATGRKCQVVVVLHVNHCRELNRSAEDAILQLKNTGSQLLNQSVLLRQINDNSEALFNLSQRLVELGVVPYYLHQLDRVIGSHHFEVPVTRGKALITELRKRLPGYSVPRYVREVPGESGKQVIC